MKRIVVVGGRGRLGAALVRAWGERHDVVSLARPEIDLADADGLWRVLDRLECDVLVNTAALTNVDRCESARDEARAVNATAPGAMAAWAAARGIRLIHVSTDYVFDGEKCGPYTEDDAPRPLGYYGQTKWEGEQATLAASDAHLVVRVSWVFGPDKPSFVDSIIERARTQPRVEAIADKTSSPTFAWDVAAWLEPFFSPSLPGGIFHACNEGACSWQEYGQHALDCAARAGLSLTAQTVEPIALRDMAAFVAPRPPHTAMSTEKLARVTGITPRSWRDALSDYISQHLSSHASILS